MSGTTKIATTSVEGWQTMCRQWAAAGESFEIQGVNARHLAFCRDLCRAYDYACHYQSQVGESTALFRPEFE